MRTGRVGSAMAKPRPFRFAVQGERIGSREELVGIARAAEETGYSTFLIRDHFVEEPFGHQLAPLTTLATVASVTERLRVGTLVLANDYRHPVLLAKEAATLDLLSGGRFELGIGAGFLRPEYEQAGLPFEPAGVRVERFEESLRVLKGLFADEPLTFSGKHYSLTALDSYPKPIQRPHPPILIGAGRKRMLSIAAREADIVGLLTVSTSTGMRVDDPRERLAATVAEKLGWIREAAGDRLDEIELSTGAMVVLAGDRQLAAEELMRSQGWNRMPVEDVLEMPSVFVGSVDQIVETMQERRERYGFSYYVVPDRAMETVAAIVARLAGA